MGKNMTEIKKVYINIIIFFLIFATLVVISTNILIEITHPIPVENSPLIIIDKVIVGQDAPNYFFIASKNNKLVEIRTTIKKYYNYNIGDTILLK